MNTLNQYDLTSEELDEVSGGGLIPLAFAAGVAFAYWAA